MPVDMKKIEREAPGLVSLAKKSQFAVNKHGLDGQKAKVALLLDASISIQHLYSSGAIQAAAEKVLAVATQFDDDGDIDVFFFHNDCWYAGTLSIADYKGGIDRLFGRSRFGGTEYGPAFKKVTDHFFKGGLFRSADKSVPVYVAFLTDGATQNARAALKAAQDSSENPIFFQSIGIGNPSEFTFIENDLNNHGGKVDNFGYVTYRDITKVSDVDLLDGLLNEFPGALAKMRAAGTLK